MAKKLSWGSNFSTDDLRVDHEDDIYENFPFLQLKENGMQMTALDKLHSPNENTVRGATGFIKTKQQAIKGSVKKGWDRTSWPIPFLQLEKRATIFDRRHTFGACQELNLEYGNIEEVPTAEYERIFPKIGGVINSFCDESILMMASMWGNVYGPIADDTKDHQFENTIIKILRLEAKRLDTELHSLFTFDVAEKVFRFMGARRRYSDPRTLTRIPNNVVAALNSAETVKGTNCVNYDKDSVDKFIAENPIDWKPSNSQDAENVYRVYTISKEPWHIRDVINRLLQTVCKLENEHKEGEPLKTLKVLLWNEKQGRKADEIVKSRDTFVKELNDTWYTRRDNVLANIPNDILDLKENFRKRLNDFNLEIWCMKQLENEEVHELVFDTGD